MPVFDFFTSNLSELYGYLFDANKRIFWMYVASSVALAFIAFIFVGRTTGVTLSPDKPQNFLSFLFPKRVWLAKSAKQDYALFIINKLFKAALFPLIVVTMVPIALGVSSVIESLFGVIEHIALPAGAVIGIFTLFLFLVDDFTRFLLHYLLHKVPVLWEFHKVHHSAKVLTPMTIYRSHPVENYLYACRMALTQGLVVGVCYYFFGPNLKMYDIFGANAFVFAFNFMGSNLRHSHIWLSWGDKVENWLISPAQHQVHHSSQAKYFDVNFGSALAIWDRMAKCLVKASTVKELTLGVSSKEADHSTLWKIYSQPFVRIFKRFSGVFNAKR